MVSIVGGGGKSALLFRLSEQLNGRVVLTTTTRIFRAQIARAVASCSAAPSKLEAALDRVATGLLVVGEIDGEKAFGVPRHLPGSMLADARVDFVVVEADGSRMRPAKAPGAHEPVVPPETTHLVPVIGIDALGGPIAERTHRPERVCELTGLSKAQPLDEAAAGVLLGHALGGCKNAPIRARVMALINKVHDSHDAIRAHRIAERALEFERIDRVLFGALEADLAAPWTVIRRD